MNTDTLPSAGAIYLPLVAARGPVGVLALRPADPRRLLDPDQIHLLETFANQISVAIERARLADEAQIATVEIETERLRNSLLSSVSHDLRTPLASITGAASTLLQADGALTPEANPNGSLESIAGILNTRGNVLGIMPHPERCAEAILGNDAGKLIFLSMLDSLTKGALLGSAHRTPCTSGKG